MKRWFMLIVVGIWIPLPLVAEEAAEETRWRELATTGSYQRGEPSRARLSPDGARVYFLRSGPTDTRMRLYTAEVATGEEKEWISPDEVLRGRPETLSAEEKARRERLRERGTGFTSFALSRDGARLLLPLAGRLFVVGTAERVVRELPGENWLTPELSPDGTAVAAVKDGELHVIEVGSGEVRRLTEPRGEGISHGTAEFVAQEELDRREGFWWSPDSQSLLFQETDEREVEVRYLGDPLHPEAKPTEFRYPRPGQANAKVRLGRVGRRGGDVVWVQATFDYLVQVVWSQEGPLTAHVMDRAQQEGRLLRINPTDGATQELVRERDAAWLNVPEAGALPLWRRGGSEFVWATERQGAWQLERRAADGRLLAVITEPQLGLRRVVNRDDYDEDLWVLASARPGESQLWRVGLEGGPAESLDSTPGVQDVQRSNGLRLHRWKAKQGGQVWKVVDDAGRERLTLRSAALVPPGRPRVEWLEAVGPKALRAAVVRPPDFVPGQTYPVILSVYGGPGSNHVAPTVDSYFTDQTFAAAGFVVVRMDGRGTPGRGRDWERAIRGNFVDVALNDQIEGLQALGARYPELDLERVGIAGWSFGGYLSAMAVLKRPDVFKCALVGAPVIEWESYDTAYTERYLGLPAENPQAYEISRVTPWAARLERPLLLVHGVTDDNVYVEHALKLVDAAFRAGRVLDFLPLAGTHMAGSSDPEVAVQLNRRYLHFWRTHLLGKENPAQRVAK